MRVAAGDREAFATVYDALSARVFGLVLRVLVDRSQAEEVTQEVFVDMWRKAPTYDSARGSAIGWALALAHSKAVDRVRSSQSQRDRDERIGIRDSVAPFDVVSEAADVRLEGKRVREALETLTEAHREAIVLAYYGGLTQTEIAERLQTPLGTVKTRLRDGMIRLRAAMGVS
ncbi:ECF RNA polymerase sigma factor SigK [Agrococcus versicolor]|uniref:ECF RNA polymerase sigma factor SigK n=2 Tax=Agrococcus versicolor TaxID=501482 RepID=A0ABP5MDV6_9MICO